MYSFNSLAWTTRLGIEITEKNVIVLEHGVYCRTFQMDEVLFSAECFVTTKSAGSLNTLVLDHEKETQG